MKGIYVFYVFLSILLEFLLNVIHDFIISTVFYDDNVIIVKFVR